MRNYYKLSAVALLFVALTSFVACNKENDPNKNTPQEGTADITLTSGGVQTKLNGPCGWATAMGVKYIGAKDANNSLRVFECSFNIDNPPAQTTTYTLVPYNVTDEDPTHANMTFTELVDGKFREWKVSNSTNSVTLTVYGNKVTVNLAGITLSPGSDNTGAYANPGVLTGTLTFYK